MKVYFCAAVFALLSGCSQAPSKAARILDLSADKSAADQLWALKRVTKPSYPKVAQMTKKAGCARFIITIDQHGNSKDITFLESFPAGMFISESREALSDWHWQATSKNSQQHTIKRTVQIDYFMKQAINLDEARTFCTI